MILLIVAQRFLESCMLGIIMCQPWTRTYRPIHNFSKVKKKIHSFISGEFNSIQNSIQTLFIALFVHVKCNLKHFTLKPKIKC